MRIKYCTRCVMPHTKPDLRLDDSGVCNACRSYGSRKEVDWESRQKELLVLLERYRSTNASLWDEVWQLAWKLDRQGKVLPLPDIVIACCANRAGAAVMTTDRHFDLIDGLTVIRP